MTFLHKLSQRLARLKALCALAGMGLVACEKPVALTDPAAPGVVTRLAVSPKNVTLLPNQTTDLMAVGLTAGGDTGTIAVSWSVTGGTMLDTSANGGRHYGHYKSGTQPGQYKVIGNGNPGGLSDTTTVVVNPVPVASVSVSPVTSGVTVGQTAQLSATTRDSAGNVLTGRTVTWASSNSGVATVSGTGLVMGVTAGTATITAISEGQSGQASLSVSNVPVATVTVSPASASVTVGQTAQLSATAKDAAGNVLSGRAVTWTSSNSGVVTVSGSGLVTGVAAGSATITAASEGQSGTASISVANVPVATVTVSPASASVTVGQTAQLSATAKDAAGNVLSGRAITWTSSNSGVATVTGTGLVTGVGAGSATGTATSEGQSGTATITVTAPPPPPPPPAAPGAVTDLAIAGVTDSSATLSFTEVSDGTGQPASYDIRFAAGTISWGSATSVTQGSCKTPVAGTSVGSRRTCTVLALSSSTAYGFQLVAYRGTLGADAVFGALSNTVSGTTAAGAPKPVASVTVSPTSASVTVGGTQQFTATLRDASGAVLTGRTVTWTSTALNVATVSAGGLVSALLAGTTTITATSEGKSGTATITVTALPPPPSGSWPNEPVGFSLIGDYGFGDVIPVTSDPIALGSSGWQAQWNPVGNGTLISDGGAAFSPSGVYQVKYPVGFVDGTAPSTVEHPLSTRTTELYWGFWWKPSNPFQSDASGVNKIAFIWTPSGNTDLLYFDLSPNPWRIRCMDDLYAGGGPDAGRRDEPNVNTTVITLGQWHRIEIYVNYSSGSNANGIVKWWVDGVLNGSYTNLKMVQDGGFNSVSFSPTYGGAGGDVKTETDYYWFDHTRLSKP